MTMINRSLIEQEKRREDEILMMDVTLRISFHAVIVAKGVEK
jgi:hypothetical protein